MQVWLFWGLAAVSVVASLLVVGQRNAVRSVLMLAVLLTSMSAVYLLLSAPLVAFIQTVIHTATVLVVVLPVVLFLDLPDEVDDGVEVGPGSGARRAGVALAAALVVELSWAFQRVRGAGLPSVELMPDGGPVAMGLRVVSEYTPGFALTAMLLLVAAVGVVLLVRREVP